MTLPRIRATLEAELKAQGLSRRALGRAAGVRHSRINEILNADGAGSRTAASLDDPRFRRTLIKLAGALGLREGALLPPASVPPTAYLGAAIRAARLARGMSQEYLAGVVGAGQKTVDLIEKQPQSGYFTTPELSAALASYLGVELTREVDADHYITADGPCLQCGALLTVYDRWCGRCGVPTPPPEKATLFASPRKDQRTDE
jgi:transcriptional regulator with XRE-family HTH domain